MMNHRALVNLRGDDPGWGQLRDVKMKGVLKRRMVVQ
jgi:hypothetical protein